MPKLRWTQTNDAIELAVIDHNVYEYFVEQLNSCSLNQYTMSDLGYASLSQELQQCFERAKTFIQQRLCLTDFDFDLDPSDQANLNYLHSQWVKVHQQYPNIEKIVDQFLPGDMAKINMLIHSIEDLTQHIEAITPDPDHTMPNPFGTKVLGFGFCNISIPYINLGRTSWQKWQHNDCDPGSDLNNFEEIYTTLNLNVWRVETLSEPIGYRSWCEQNQIPCVGSQIPLANFDKLNDNLLQYRQLFLKNSLIENNFITLE